MGTCPKPLHISTEGSQKGVYFTSDTLAVHFVAGVYFNGAGIRCCVISWGGKCKYFVTVLKWIFQGSVLERLLLLLLLLTLENTCKKTFMLLEVALFELHCCVVCGSSTSVFFSLEEKNLLLTFSTFQNLYYLSNGILLLVRVIFDTVLLL